MNNPNFNLSGLAVEEAHQILKQFEAAETQTVAGNKPLAEQLRQALAIVSTHSDYQILGICADTLAEGCQALQAYATALGYTPSLDLQPIEGSVYIKFNPQLSSCYADSYSGSHRGVLVSCQSAAAPGLNEMYGHLPLDLFEAE